MENEVPQVLLQVMEDVEKYEAAKVGSQFAYLEADGVLNREDSDRYRFGFYNKEIKASKTVEGIQAGRRTFYIGLEDNITFIANLNRYEKDGISLYAKDQQQPNRKRLYVLRKDEIVNFHGVKITDPDQVTFVRGLINHIETSLDTQKQTGEAKSVSSSTI